MEVALPKLLLGFKETSAPVEGDDFMSRQLASSLALEIVFGRSSPTFQDLYEAKLVLDDFGADYSLGAGVGYGIVGGETPNPDRLRDAILERMASLLETGISDEEFERAKKMFLGGFVRGFNSLEYIATNYTYFMFHGFDLFRSLDLFSGFTKDRLEERLRSLLDPENYASYVVLPTE
jgi:predicted Zn-dependent peptidase